MCFNVPPWVCQLRHGTPCLLDLLICMKKNCTLHCKLLTVHPKLVGRFISLRATYFEDFHRKCAPAI